jgi:hypothetical protein
MTMTTSSKDVLAQLEALGNKRMRAQNTRSDANLEASRRGE